jgi:NAD-dependent deacetylase
LFTGKKILSILGVLFMSLTDLKELIEKSKKITVLTGAGISTESGIPDFRSPGGIWSKYNIVTIQEFMSSLEKRKYYWRLKTETIPQMLETEPNPAHYALGRLDRQGRLFWLLTQNIDGLHERGGVSQERIVNLHGTNSEAICLSCKKIYEILPLLDRVKQGDEDPRCDVCNGFLKPNTVSFGQSLDPEHLAIADRASRECDLFMALGSSLVVSPACNFVDVAYNSRKPIIIINRDQTPYDGIAAYKLTDSLAQMMPDLIP